MTARLGRQSDRANSGAGTKYRPDTHPGRSDSGRAAAFKTQERLLSRSALSARSRCAGVAREMYVAQDEQEYRHVRSSCQALRIGAMVGTGSVVRKLMMTVLQSVGFSTSSPCEVPGMIASSLAGRLR